MKVNATLLTTMVLAIVIGGTILAWILSTWRKKETSTTNPPRKLPLGPVGFKMLPACAIPERA
jgi:hypothetical protein